MVLGAIWVTVAMALLAGLIAFGRYAALAGYDPLQVVFFRNLFCVLWMLPLLAWRGPSLYRSDQFHLYGIRVGISYVAMLGMFHAVALIPLGEVTAIGFLSPLFGALFAVLLLGERPGMRRWMALLVGFGGAMIMLNPGLSGPGAGQAFALMSALAIGLIGPLVKLMTRRDDPDRVVFLTNLLLTPLSLLPAIAVWRWPDWDMLGLFAAMGLCAVLGHMALVRGYAVTEASNVMMFKFIRLPFAVLIGFLVFAETIGWRAWLGGAVIFLASTYVAHREARRKREGLKGT